MLARPRGPNQPMNATVGSRSPVPSRDTATGSRRSTVRASTAMASHSQRNPLPKITRTKAPPMNHTTKASRSAATSISCAVRGSSTTVLLVAPKTSPPTKAAMKALASRISAKPSRATGMASMISIRPVAVLVPRARDQSRARAASQATAPPTTTARVTGTTLTEKIEGVSVPSSAARTARAISTTGVARPSFSPLSTFSARRTRAGTTGFSTVAEPSPASVGVIAAAISRAPARPISGRIPRTTPSVASSARGNPISSSLPGTQRSASSLPMRTVDASWNSTTTSVISAIALISSYGIRSMLKKEKTMIPANSDSMG